MPDARDYSRAGDCAGDSIDSIVQRLRSLPQARPGDDGWPRLAAALQHRRGDVRPRPHARARRWWPLAVAAAAVLVALAIPRIAQMPAPSHDEQIAVEPPSGQQVDRLIAQSQWLERLVAADALAPVAQDGDQALLEIGLRDRLREIDLALASTPTAPVEDLWRARIGTLAQLAEVKWAGRQASWAEGASAPAGPAPAVTWSN